MADNLFTLGGIVFRPEHNNLHGFTRRTEYRHNFVDALRGEGGRTFTGKGADVISLPGTVFPGQYGNPNIVNEVRAQARVGQPLQLIDGDGYLIGRYTISAVEEDREVLLEGGKGRVMSYVIELRKDPIPLNV